MNDFNIQRDVIVDAVVYATGRSKDKKLKPFFTTNSQKEKVSKHGVSTLEEFNNTKQIIENDEELKRAIDAERNLIFGL
ncbi:MAG: hypothetical protein ACRC28_18735 [Clostridium sp.]|uniref:hypothetical protein n=1 Tax=Clostridium sp. TaxID=1506 RepID=UPI003F3A065E